MNKILLKTEYFSHTNNVEFPIPNELKSFYSLDELKNIYQLSEEFKRTIFGSLQAVNEIISGKTNKLMIFTGHCSLRTQSQKMFVKRLNLTFLIFLLFSASRM